MGTKIDRTDRNALQHPQNQVRHSEAQNMDGRPNPRTRRKIQRSQTTRRNDQPNRELVVELTLTAKRLKEIQAGADARPESDNLSAFKYHCQTFADANVFSHFTKLCLDAEGQFDFGTECFAELIDCLGEYLANGKLDVRINPSRIKSPPNYKTSKKLEN